MNREETIRIIGLNEIQFKKSDIIYRVIGKALLIEYILDIKVSKKSCIMRTIILHNFNNAVLQFGTERKWNIFLSPSERKYRSTTYYHVYKVL